VFVFFFESKNKQNDIGRRPFINRSSSRFPYARDPLPFTEQIRKIVNINSLSLHNSTYSRPGNDVHARVCVWLSIVFQLVSFLAFSLHPDTNELRVFCGEGGASPSPKIIHTRTIPGYDNRHHPSARVEGLFPHVFGIVKRSFDNCVFIYCSPNAENAYASPAARLTCFAGE